MSQKLKAGDRVRIGTSQKIYVVAEIDPPGCTPCLPATYTLRLTPEGGKGVELLYGDAVIVKVA
jgi:hypothetical protein